MKKHSKKTIGKTLSLICTLMLAIVCVNSFGLKPQNAYAACSHQFNGSYQTTWPTCTKNGERVGRCIKCGTVLNRQILYATGHNWVDKQVIQTRSCTRNGIVIQRCTKCGTTRTNTLYAWGHSCNGSWTTTKKATCKQEGERVLKCTRSGCGAVLQRETIPKTSHSYYYEYDRAAGWRRKHCYNCDLDDWDMKLNEFNCPVQGTKKSFVTTGVAKGVTFSGELNYDNTISAQYIKMTSGYIEGSLKLGGEESQTVTENLAKYGIKLNFNSDGTGKAYLVYKTMDDRINEAATDEEVQASWQFYAYVRRDGNDLIFNPKDYYKDANPTNFVWDGLNNVRLQAT